MPIKNNRNSRDDKSPKNRFSKPSSKKSSSEKPEGSNSFKKKKFEGGKNSFGRDSFKKSDSRYREDKRTEGRKEFKPEEKAGKSAGFRKRTGDADRGAKRNFNTGYKAERPERRKPASFEERKWTSEERMSDKKLRPKKSAAPKANDELIRLNRYIANAGVCSRRKADELIQAGVISVNGEVVSELGYRVDPSKDVVRYNGELLKREKMVYVLLNKPKDYITTTDDPQERKTVMHLVEKATNERIYPVGRLDRNTTGLLLLTNDGELAEKLSHPRNNVVKIYQVELNKSLSQGDLNKISFGLELEDGVIKPDAVSYIQGGTKREIGIQIHSGKNRIVRRIFEHLGYDVIKLDRVIYANLTKKDLPRGRWRHLEDKEVIQLKHLMNVKG